MDLSNLYSASKAKKDWNAKTDEKNSHVDEDKILLILAGIKTQILSLEIDSKNSNIGYKEYIYSRHLSVGEQVIFKKLGYTIKWETDNGMAGDYFRISW